MATAFSDEEKIEIEESLYEAAKKCLQKFGVKKTTVERITQMAGISKGSFYNFYPKKEILFFKVLEEYQNDVMNDFVNRLKIENKIDVQRFTELLYGLYQGLRSSFIWNIIQHQEIELLMKKLPQNMLLKHYSLDEVIAEAILCNIKIKEEVSADIVSAYLKAIFMNMLHVEVIGEEQFDDVLKLLIKGLAQQIVKEG